MINIYLQSNADRILDFQIVNKIEQKLSNFS